MLNLNSERLLSLENFQGEQWKPVDGFDGMYEISNFGRVKSHKHHTMIRRLKSTRDGYVQVQLRNRAKSKDYLIHRLVYSHFIGELVDDLVIDHIDGDKTNNNVNNLQQITERDNIKKSTSNKLARGVSSIDGGKYFTAHLGVKYNRAYLGTFKTIKEANQAYEDALLYFNTYGTLPSINVKKVNKVINGYKVCRTCNESKPVSEYQKDGTTYKSSCKKCQSKKRREKSAMLRGDKPYNMHKKTWERIKYYRINEV